MATVEQIATVFKVTVNQVRALFAKNADQLDSMADQAMREHSKINGYTEQQLRSMAKAARKRAQS